MLVILCVTACSLLYLYYKVFMVRWSTEKHSSNLIMQYALRVKQVQFGLSHKINKP